VPNGTKEVDLEAAVVSDNVLLIVCRHNSCGLVLCLSASDTWPYSNTVPVMHICA
jgi:hypothetical protein